MLIYYFKFLLKMSGLLNKVISPLRGGGCGSNKVISKTEVDLKSDI